MEVKKVIGERGEIVIPRSIRDYLGMKPGSKISLIVREKELVIRPVHSPKEFVEDFTRVPKKLKKKVDIKKLIEKQMEERYDIR